MRLRRKRTLTNQQHWLVPKGILQLPNSGIWHSYWSVWKVTLCVAFIHYGCYGADRLALH